MVLLDADMIVTRPLDRADRRRRPRGSLVAFRNDSRALLRRVGRAARPRRGPRRPLPDLERDPARARAGGAACCRWSTSCQAGSTASGRGSAAASDDRPALLPRPGRAQRGRSTRGSRPRSSSPSTRGWRRSRRSPAFGCSSRGRCAAPIATAPSRTCSITPPASRGWCGCAATSYSRLLTRLLLAPTSPLRLEPGELPLRAANRLGRRRGRAARHRPADDCPRGRPAAAAAPEPGERVAQRRRRLDRTAPGPGRGDRLDRPRVPGDRARARASRPRARGRRRDLRALARGGRGRSGSASSRRRSRSASPGSPRATPRRRLAEAARDLVPVLADLRPGRRRQRPVHARPGARRRGRRSAAGDADPAPLPGP